MVDYDGCSGKMTTMKAKIYDDQCKNSNPMEGKNVQQVFTGSGTNFSVLH